MALWSCEEIAAALTAWREALEAPQHRGFQPRAYMYERFIELCGGSTERALPSFRYKCKSMQNTALLARAYNDRKLAKRPGAYASGTANLPWFRISLRRRRKWFDERSAYSYGYVELEPATYAELLELINLEDEVKREDNLCHRRVHLRRDGPNAPWEAVRPPTAHVQDAVELAATVLASNGHRTEPVERSRASTPVASTSTWSRDSSSGFGGLSAAADVALEVREAKDRRSKHAFALLTAPVELDEMFTTPMSPEHSSSTSQQQQIVIDDSDTESDHDNGVIWSGSGDDDRSRSSSRRSLSAGPHTHDHGNGSASAAPSCRTISALWTMPPVHRTPSAPSTATPSQASSPALASGKTPPLPLQASATASTMTDSDDEHAMIPIRVPTAASAVSRTTTAVTAPAAPSTTSREPNRELAALVRTLEVQSQHLHEMLAQANADRAAEREARERDQRTIDALAESVQALSDRFEASQAEARVDRTRRMAAEKERFDAQTRALVDMRRYAFGEREALVRDFGIKQVRWEMRSAHQLQELEGLRLEIAKLQSEARVREAQLAVAKAVQRAAEAPVRAPSPLSAALEAEATSPLETAPLASPLSSATLSTSTQTTATLDMARLGTTAGTELAQARELNQALLAEALSLGTKRAAKRSSASKTPATPLAPAAAASGPVVAPTVTAPLPVARKAAAGLTKRGPKTKRRVQYTVVSGYRTEEARLAAEKRIREFGTADVFTTRTGETVPATKKQRLIHGVDSSSSSAPSPWRTCIKSPHTMRGNAVYIVQSFSTEEAYVNATKQFEHLTAAAPADLICTRSTPSSPAPRSPSPSPQSPSEPVSAVPSDTTAAPQSPPPPLDDRTPEERLRAEKEQAEQDAEAYRRQCSVVVLGSMMYFILEKEKYLATRLKNNYESKWPNMPFPPSAPIPGSERTNNGKVYIQVAQYRTESDYVEAAARYKKLVRAQAKAQKKATAVAAAKAKATAAAATATMDVETDARRSSSAAVTTTASSSTPLQPPPPQPSTVNDRAPTRTSYKPTTAKAKQKRPRQRLSKHSVDFGAVYRREEARLRAEKAQARQERQAAATSTALVPSADAVSRESSSTTVTSSLQDSEMSTESSSGDSDVSEESEESEEPIAETPSLSSSVTSEASEEPSASSPASELRVREDARVSPPSPSSPKRTNTTMTSNITSGNGSGDIASGDISTDVTPTVPQKRARKRKQEPTAIQRKAAQYIMLPGSSASSPVQVAFSGQSRDARPSQSPPTTSTEQFESAPRAAADAETTLLLVTSADAALEAPATDGEPAHKKAKVTTPSTEDAPAPSAHDTEAPESSDAIPSETPPLSPQFEIRSETPAQALSSPSADVPDAEHSDAAPEAPPSSAASGADSPSPNAPTRRSSRVVPSSKTHGVPVRIPLRKLSTAKPPPSSKPVTPDRTPPTRKAAATASSSSSSSVTRSKAAASRDLVSRHYAPADAPVVTNENATANASKTPSPSAKPIAGARKSPRGTEARDPSPTPAVTLRLRRSRTCGV